MKNKYEYIEKALDFVNEAWEYDKLYHEAKSQFDIDKFHSKTVTNLNKAIIILSEIIREEKNC